MLDIITYLGLPIGAGLLTAGAATVSVSGLSILSRFLTENKFWFIVAMGILGIGGTVFLLMTSKGDIRVVDFLKRLINV